MIRVFILTLLVGDGCRCRASGGDLRGPARKILQFVPYADRVPDQCYDELPPSCIHYIMERKLTFNKRVAAKQTENDLVVAPGDFWNEEPSAKIQPS